MATDSEIITRTGPGTAMGQLMRQYWVPAALSSELVADGAPVRLMLLGEQLIGFRDSSGRVGIIENACPHRCASMFFGRNEEGGIRCAYHGWKFDVDGACLEMPNVPPHLAFADKVHARAYKVAERNGIVWTYMGDRAEAPPMPSFEAALMPVEDANVFAVQRECNWLQALEGDIDTSHFSFLHMGKIKPEEADQAHHGRYGLIERAPEYHVADTDWGTMYAAYRPADPGNTYWRFAHFMFPFWTIPPDGHFKDHVVARAWVPMDDTHIMFFHMSWKKNTPGLRNLRDGSMIPGAAVGGNRFIPNGPGWFDRWRLVANRDNDYLMDRDTQKNASFTGINGIHLQDQAITESMGGIVDHAKEHLAVSDLMISRTRRRIAEAARAAASGIVGPGVDNPQLYHGARGGDFVAPNGIGWVQAYGDEIRRALNPTGILKAAAAE